MDIFENMNPRTREKIYFVLEQLIISYANYKEITIEEVEKLFIENRIADRLVDDLRYTYDTSLADLCKFVDEIVE